MRLKQVIFLPLFLCGAFLFRLYVLNFYLPGTQGQGHTRAASLKRVSIDNQTRRRSIKQTVAHAQAATVHAKKLFKKVKAVRSKKWRLPALDFFPYALNTTTYTLADQTARVCIDDRKQSVPITRRHLALSVLRI